MESSTTLNASNEWPDISNFLNHHRSTFQSILGRPPMSDPREDYLASIKEIAINAGAILLRYFEGEDLHEDTKATVADIVTDADFASDNYIREQFALRFPTFGVITEEGCTIAPKNPGPDELWLCADPLDGTTNFSCNLPIFSVSIAILNQQHRPIAGVVHDPVRNETFSAILGKGSFLESPSGKRQLRVRPNTESIKCLVATGFHPSHVSSDDNNLREIAEILPKVRCIRRLGSACLDMCYTAAARLDGYWERGPHIWDVAAGWLIATEAGCKVTTYQGVEWTRETIHKPLLTIVEANPVIHAVLLAGIQKAREGRPDD
jgi:myo-inositol-1(or 4)-monophosphatase